MTVIAHVEANYLTFCLLSIVYIYNLRDYIHFKKSCVKIPPSNQNWNKGTNVLSKQNLVDPPPISPKLSNSLM